MLEFCIATYHYLARLVKCYCGYRSNLLHVMASSRVLEFLYIDDSYVMFLLPLKFSVSTNIGFFIIHDCANLGVLIQNGEW